MRGPVTNYISYISTRLLQSTGMVSPRALSTSTKNVWFLVLPLWCLVHAEKPATCQENPLHYVTQFRISAFPHKKGCCLLRSQHPGVAKGNGIQVFRPNKHPDSAPGTGCLNEPITAQRANAIPDKGESDGYSQSKGPVQLCMRPLFVFVCCSRFTTI